MKGAGLGGKEKNVKSSHDSILGLNSVWRRVRRQTATGARRRARCMLKSKTMPHGIFHFFQRYAGMMADRLAAQADGIE